MYLHLFQVLVITLQEIDKKTGYFLLSKCNEKLQNITPSTILKSNQKIVNLCFVPVNIVLTLTLSFLFFLKKNCC